MAATITIYNYFKMKMVDGSDIDLANDTIKIAFCTSTYTPDIDADEWFDDISNELSGGGYTAGGYELTGMTLTLDTTNNRIKIDDTGNVSEAGITATNLRYGVIYKSTGTAGTSPLIAYVDFGENLTFSGATITITWHANGISLIT